ncbi:MAG: hypothetical protein CL681_00725 [Blastopirellula sp.]|nr:hypothetical protein [Blastopirellula sp.]
MIVDQVNTLQIVVGRLGIVTSVKADPIVRLVDMECGVACDHQVCLADTSRNDRRASVIKMRPSLASLKEG